MIGPQANLTTPQAVMSDHGGELTFWLAWLADELNAELRDWFRVQAAQDAVLQQNLESVDQPAAREQLHNALEATNYLTPREAAGGARPGTEPLTGFALKEEDTEATLLAQQDTHDDMRQELVPLEGYVSYLMEYQRPSKPDLHRRVSQCLFQLLAEVEVPLPASNEPREATALLQHLAGRPAVDRFRRLDRWLNEARLRAGGAGPLALDRVLHWLTPELFQSDAEGFRFHLSFRLYLRSRFKDYCKQRGWLPAGPHYQDLNTAFADLQRDRIGQIVGQAIEESGTEALEQARVSPRQVLQWLTVAP